jgi:hypothetical protein
MANEIFNQANVTPRRLHTLLRLVAMQTGITSKQLGDLLQPLEQEHSFARNALAAARYLRLVSQDEQDRVTLAVDAGRIEKMGSYMGLIQQRLLGVTDSSAANYNFNLFTAWYATQGADVLSMSPKDMEAKFNTSLYSHVSIREFNSTKYNGWRQWALFLGLGWARKRGHLEQLVPDCTRRIAPLLPELLPGDEQIIPFSSFADRLATRCPELDGGQLFLQAWQASHSGLPGHGLSLMLSTGLRVLHDIGEIELVRVSDARETWHLYHTATHSIQSDVTHIRRRGAS